MDSNTLLQPVRPQDVQDWVYISDTDDEPSVYETEASSLTQDVAASQPIDILFKSDAPVEEPLSDADTDREYYGDDDDDIIDDRVPPETAFELFLARNFPIDVTRHDFSGSIYRTSNTTTTITTDESTNGDSGPRVRIPKSATSFGLPGAEGRSERLARLVSEVDALATEVGLNSNEDSAAQALSQLTRLREQLRDIDHHCSQRTPLVSVSRPTKLSQSEQKSEIVSQQSQQQQQGTSSISNKNGEMNNTSAAKPSPNSESGGLETSEVTLQIVSPSVSTLSTLEQRVSQLESRIGVHDLEREFDGSSVADVVSDVRTRLSLATDTELTTRLRDDARRIAGILNSNNNPRLDDALRLGTLLDRLHEWQPVIDAVPIVVDRLASVRRLHQEAAHFVEAASKLAAKVDELDSRVVQNRTLINTVRNTMEINLSTVHENIDALARKLEQPANQNPHLTLFETNPEVEEDTTKT